MPGPFSFTNNYISSSDVTFSRKSKTIFNNIRNNIKEGVFQKKGNKFGSIDYCINKHNNTGVVNSVSDYETKLAFSKGKYNCRPCPKDSKFFLGYGTQTANTTISLKNLHKLYVSNTTSDNPVSTNSPVGNNSIYPASNTVKITDNYMQPVTDNDKLDLVVIDPNNKLYSFLCGQNRQKWVSNISISKPSQTVTLVNEYLGYNNTLPKQIN